MDDTPPKNGAPTGPPAEPAGLEQLRPWQRLHLRLLLFSAVVTLLVLGAMAVFFFRRGVSLETEALRARLSAIAISLAQTLPGEELTSLSAAEGEGGPAHAALVSQFAAIAQREPEVASIYVLLATESPTHLRFAVDWVRRGKAAQPGQLYDATRARRMREGLSRPVAEDEIYVDEWGPVLSGYAPLAAAGAPAGLVGVDVSAERLQGLRARVLATVAGVFGAALVLLSAMAWLVGQSVRRSLGRILDAASAVASGRLDVRVGGGRDDELGILGQHFDQMAQGLQERERLRDTFGRYLSPEVTRRLLERRESFGLGGEEREVTVLFADLKSFSAVSERLAPEQVLRLLDGYVGAMAEEVEAQGGCVLELLGDGLVCVFGAPADLPEHAERAVIAAQAMRRRLARLNEEWRQEGLTRAWSGSGVDRLAARIGVHTGRVAAGNLGSERRMKYGIIGDAVNVAARCEALNGELGTDLLITRDTLSRLPERLRAAARDLGKRSVKGREQPVAVFTFA